MATVMATAPALPSAIAYAPKATARPAQITANATLARVRSLAAAYPSRLGRATGQTTLWRKTLTKDLVCSSCRVVEGGWHLESDTGDATERTSLGKQGNPSTSGGPVNSPCAGPCSDQGRAGMVGSRRAPAGARPLLGAMAVAEILGREAEVQAVGRFLDGPAPRHWSSRDPPASARPPSGRRARARTQRGTSRPRDASVRGRDGSRYGWPDGSPGRRLRSSTATRCRRRSGLRLPWRCCARSRSRRGPARDGVGRRARAGAPRSGGVTSAACGRRPAVAGPATAATLTFALRRLGDAPVLLARDRSLGGQRAVANRRPDRLAIPPLDIESLSRLIARELGQRLPRPVVRRIATIAAGNAFLAIELARVAIASGTDADELSPAALSRSSHVRRLAETRVRVLPEPTRKALAIVAALGEPRAPTLVSCAPGRSRARPGLRRRGHRGAGRSRALHAPAAGRRRARQPLPVAPEVHPPRACRPRGHLRGTRAASRRRDDRAVRRDRLRDRARRRGRALARRALLCGAVARGGRPSDARGGRLGVGRPPRERGQSPVSRRGTPREHSSCSAAPIRESPPGLPAGSCPRLGSRHEHVPLQEGMVQLRVALEECGPDAAARAECQLGLGMHPDTRRRLRTARRHLAEALHSPTTLDDEELQVTALSGTGHLDERMAPGSGRRCA